MPSDMRQEALKQGGAVVAVIVFGFLGNKMLDNQAASQRLAERQVAADEKLAETLEHFFLIWSGAKPPQ